jgi:TolB-like protein
MASVWGELKRRNVVRVAIAYVVASWLILQLTDVLKSLLTLPAWIGEVVFVLLLIGFVVALILAWAYEMTPEGVKREKDVDRSQSITRVTGRKLDFVIIGILSVALIVLAVDEFVWEAKDDQETAVTTDRKSIAVLPFVNMSSDPEQEYFSDGLSEELLNLLARIPELRVTSRSSAFYYKNKDIQLDEVGKELGVAHILEGSVRRSGDTIRITAQLIDVSNDSHLWSETWDRTLDDVFVVQDEIAQAVISGLRVRLLGGVPRTATTSPEAYELYLQSKITASQLTADSYLNAERLALRALELDGTYVPAWLALSSIYAVGSSSGAWHPHEGYPKSREAALEALHLDPDNAQAHARLSAIASNYDYDWETASRELKLALALAPQEPAVMRRAASLARYRGDYAESIRILEQLEILDPISSGIKLTLGYSYLGARQFERAKSYYAAALELVPGATQLNYRIGCVLLATGDYDAALSYMDKETRDGFRLAGRTMVLHAMGKTDAAASELEALIALGERWTYEIAQAHAYLGHVDESFEWMDRAIERRDQSLTTITVDPFIDNMREDPRYDEVISRLGYATL